LAIIYNFPHHLYHHNISITVADQITFPKLATKILSPFHPCFIKANTTKVVAFTLISSKGYPFFHPLEHINPTAVAASPRTMLPMT
jgi:hypothetical protein